MPRKTARARQSWKWRRRRPAPAAPPEQAAGRDPAASRPPHSCRAGSASAKQFVECRPLLLQRLFLGNLEEIRIEMAGDRVEPGPVISERLQDDGIPVTPDADLRTGKPELFRQPNGLRS